MSQELFNTIEAFELAKVKVEYQGSHLSPEMKSNLALRSAIVKYVNKMMNIMKKENENAKQDCDKHIRDLKEANDGPVNESPPDITSGGQKRRGKSSRSNS